MSSFPSASPYPYLVDDDDEKSTFQARFPNTTSTNNASMRAPLITNDHIQMNGQTATQSPPNNNSTLPTSAFAAHARAHQVHLSRRTNNASMSNVSDAPAMITVPTTPQSDEDEDEDEDDEGSSPRTNGLTSRHGEGHMHVATHPSKPAAITRFVMEDKSSGARTGRLIMAVRASLGEFVATFILIFTVCCTAMSGAVSGYTTGEQHLANSLVVMFVVTALIFSFSHISGAVMNPAVTLAFWLGGKTSSRKFILFVVAQLLGGLTAMAGIYLAYNLNEGYPVDLWQTVTVIPVSPIGAGSLFFVEFLGTAVLIFVIFKVAVDQIEDEKSKNMTLSTLANARGLMLFNATALSQLGFAPLVIGFTVGLLTLLASSTSGGIFNPIRIISPAIFSGKWDDIYIYIPAQMAGAAIAVLLSKSFDLLAFQAAKALQDSASVKNGYLK